MRLVRTDSPGRPPRLSHSSRTTPLARSPPPPPPHTHTGPSLQINGASLLLRPFPTPHAQVAAQGRAFAGCKFHWHRYFSLVDHPPSAGSDTLNPLTLDWRSFKPAASQQPRCAPLQARNRSVCVRVACVCVVCAWCDTGKRFASHCVTVNGCALS